MPRPPTTIFLDGRATDGAGLVSATVDLVLNLEVASHAFGVDVVRYGGAAKFDGAAQHINEGFAEAAEFLVGDACCLTTGGGCRHGREPHRHRCCRHREAGTG